jgi:hypothetical protein
MCIRAWSLSIDGKFINMSAHTSYLYLFKEPAPPCPRFFRLRENRNDNTALIAVRRHHPKMACDRERFASQTPFHPHKANVAALSLSDRRAGKIQIIESPPGAGRAAHYTSTRKRPSTSMPENFSSEAVRPTQELPNRGRIIGPEKAASRLSTNYLRKKSGAADFH